MTMLSIARLLTRFSGSPAPTRKEKTQSRVWAVSAAAFVVAGALLASSCSFFSRSQPRIYSLERVPPAGGAVALRGLPVALDGIELPPGADRREIAVRQPDLRLDVRSAELWSASLQPLVLHTLAVDLADRLPDGMMILPGTATPPGALRSIDVVFEELAAGPNPQVVLDARWTMRPSGGAAITRHERITVDTGTLDSAKIAAGYAQALAALADRIVAGIAAP